MIVTTRQSVVVLNLLHGTLCREGVLEDCMAIKLLGGGGTGGREGQVELGCHGRSRAPTHLMRVYLGSRVLFSVLGLWKTTE